MHWALLVSADSQFIKYCIFFLISCEIIRCLDIFFSHAAVAFSSGPAHLCGAGLRPKEDFGSIAGHNRQPWLWHCQVCHLKTQK